jgi:hypothetical protein
MAPLTRREFMKTFGVGLATFIIAGCRLSDRRPAKTVEPPNLLGTPGFTCYFVVYTTPAPTTPASLSARDRLRACWLSFNELAEKTLSGSNQAGDSTSDPFGAQLLADHRRALDELVAAGEIEPAVADLVQEAYAAAEYHVWRSNAPITCYEPMVVDYAPTSAAQLVQQSGILAEMAAKGELNSDTVAMAQKAIQHDLAFEALSREEVDALYQKLVDEQQQNKTGFPAFDQVDLEITPEMEAAAKFIVELLGKTE